MLLENFRHLEGVVPAELPPVVPARGNEGSLLSQNTRGIKRNALVVLQLQFFTRTTYQSLHVPSTAILLGNAAIGQFRIRLLELLFSAFIVHQGVIWRP